MNGILSCEGYGFTFSGEPALRGITFTLEKGSYLSVIGANGSGKSTLLKSFLRLHERGRPEGEIFLMGRALASYSQRELARLIAYVPQAGGPVPPFTVVEFLRLSRYPYAFPAAGEPGDAEAVARALRLTGMDALSGRRLNELSGGERQKAYLAAALAQGTQILALDEPASLLDPGRAAEVNALLKTLNRESGLTMITVTHDLNHPLDAGGKTLALRRGGQRYFGPSEKIASKGVLEDVFGHAFTYLPHPATGKTLVVADQL